MQVQKWTMYIKAKNMTFFKNDKKKFRLTITPYFWRTITPYFKITKLNMHVLLCQVLHLVIVKTVEFHIMLVLINCTIIIFSND